MWQNSFIIQYLTYSSINETCYTHYDFYDARFPRPGAIPSQSRPRSKFEDSYFLFNFYIFQIERHSLISKKLYRKQAQNTSPIAQNTPRKIRVKYSIEVSVAPHALNLWRHAYTQNTRDPFKRVATPLQSNLLHKHI